MLNKAQIKSQVNLMRIKYSDLCRISSCKFYSTCDRKQVEGIIKKKKVKCVNYLHLFS